RRPAGDPRRDPRREAVAERLARPARPRERALRERCSRDRRARQGEPVSAPWLRRALAALLLAPLLAACPAAQEPPAPAAPPPLEVAVAKPETRDVAREIVLPVELWAWQRVTIVAKVTGYLGAVAVDRGSV